MALAECNRWPGHTSRPRELQGKHAVARRHVDAILEGFRQADSGPFSAHSRWESGVGCDPWREEILADQYPE